MDVKNYAITLTIPSKKQVYYNRKRIMYGKLTQREQYCLLEDLISKIYHTRYYIKWVYEEHADKRLHIHAHFRGTPQDCHSFICDFYTYNTIINIQSIKNIKCNSDIQEIYDVKGWENYLNKAQDKIIFKSNVMVDEELIEQLDKGIVKIETKPERSDSPPMEYYMEKPETLPAYEKYLFGKYRNFFIEI